MRRVLSYDYGGYENEGKGSKFMKNLSALSMHCYVEF